ncbi:hypothetical protein KR100_01535 [Synechococcus sp. KORDI-100]|nr:hypothetical protein KR100_01535 [Synechococcus sp. KORDI-100]
MEQQVNGVEETAFKYEKLQNVFGNEDIMS